MDFITQERIIEQNKKDKTQIIKRYAAPRVAVGEMAVSFEGQGIRPEIFTNEMIARNTEAIPRGEMMSADDLRAFAEQTALDVSVGMAEYPTVFQ